MDVIYYYYYLFYKKILKDDEPHLLTTMALSASEGFTINVILEIFFTYFFCLSIGKWIMLLNITLFNLINYLYFHKSNRANRIVKEKPMFFNNHKLTIFIVVLFFIITLSFIFWGAPLSLHLMETHCR